MGYRRIAYWLNDNQYKTPRGHEFKNNHVHSILKKRRIRNERINRAYELTFGEWYVKDIKDSDVSIITAGVPRKPGMNREDLLDINIKIITDVANNVKKYAYVFYMELRNFHLQTLNQIGEF